MDEYLTLFGGGLAEAYRRELTDCAALCARYGLSLTPADLRDLEEGRREALAETGRVELCGGVLKALVCALGDSPYLTGDPGGTLCALQSTFYRCKTESGERLGDGELAELLAELFNGPAAGDPEYTEELALERCRTLRGGQA